MPFDLSTAKPVADAGGGGSFDLSTARPVADAQQPATAVERAAAGAAGVNKGVAHIVGLPMTALVNLANLASVGAGYLHSKVTGEAAPDSIYAPVDKANVPFTGDWNEAMLNKLGGAAENPRPDDMAARLMHAGGEGATAVIAPGAAGARIASLISGVSGAEASQVAKEAGASPGTQMLTGLAGAIAPSTARSGLAESARRVLRGGEEGRQQVEQNIATFERAGAQPSIGQASEGRFARATESLLAKTPGGAGRMSSASEKQAQDLGANIDGLAGKLAPKASGEQAGRAITKGISGDEGFVSQFKAKQESLYDELDKHIKPEARVDVANTAKALKDLNADIPGAPNISEFFKNAKIKGIEGALTKDTAAAEGGQLPYEAVKKLRTLVGREMADSGLMSDVPRSKWKALYGALSTDLETAAKGAGSDASAAFNRANQFTRAGMKRLDVLDSVVDKAGGPEAVFRAATSGTKEGATTLRAVMQSLPEDARKTVSATVLRRMGRATSGKQDDLGEKFSTETFLTNWNSLSPQAKAVLFDRYGESFRKDMDSVAKVASNLRDGSAVFRNPSGTGQAVAQTSAGVAFVMSLAHGNVGSAAAIAGGVGTANVAARAMTNPRIVKWLAQSTRAPKAAIPALLTQAARSTDPDLRELAKSLQDAQDGQRDNAENNQP